MTKDELRKEATTTVEWEYTPMIDRPTFINGYIVGAEPREEQIAKLKEENTELRDEVHTWKEAASANSYKAFQLQEESKILSMHIVELQNDKGELVDEVKGLKAQIDSMKSDLLELKNDSYDAGMYLRVDELVQKWEIKK